MDNVYFWLEVKYFDVLDTNTVRNPVRMLMMVAGRGENREDTWTNVRDAHLLLRMVLNFASHPCCEQASVDPKNPPHPWLVHLIITCLLGGFASVADALLRVTHSVCYGFTYCSTRTGSQSDRQQ